MSKAHSFHIPVMGIGFTIDTPLKVSQYGINSVISLVDDLLMEKLRKMYCEKHQLPYNEISETVADFRAKRVTSYLNLINELAEKKFEQLRNATQEMGHEIKEFFNMLPDSSSIKQEFKELTSKYFNFEEIKNWVRNNLSMGSIDVNIMTKLDKENYIKQEKLPVEFNDAHASLRGFANSNLQSTIVFSAGMNPRLYSYIENFEDFYPNENGFIKKKIALKVSDYRSALIQGKFLAKKGIWVSEYRIESGLNCGGHAFASDGFLMGPILEEFKAHREELHKSIFEILVQALKEKDKVVPSSLELFVTAQGGVGTAEEHQFLLDYYKIDSVGWGSPFLLVPEATSVDDNTREQLREAREQDLYLSGISPLGVPFNNLRNNSKDIEKINKLKEGKPGSPCPKRFLVSNSEFTKKPICTASTQYLTFKFKELDKENLSPKDYKERYNKIGEKACLCVGLSVPALVSNNIDTGKMSSAISVCPGPNIAYFNKTISLKRMVDHIYGRENVIERTDRPNMFVKELKIYLDYFKSKIEETKSSITLKQEKYLKTFANNLKEGINYYQKLFGDFKDRFSDVKSNIFNDLENSRITLKRLKNEIDNQVKIDA